MKILMGIGNSLRCDDGAGVYIAETFGENNLKVTVDSEGPKRSNGSECSDDSDRYKGTKGWKILNCGTAPENFTGVIRKEHPSLLVIIDAANMGSGVAPGEFRIIPGDLIEDVGIGTHQMPLSALINFMSDSADEIILIGIQPEIVDDGEEISESVKAGIDSLINILKKESVKDIPTLVLQTK